MDSTNVQIEQHTPEVTIGQRVETILRNVHDAVKGNRAQLPHDLADEIIATTAEGIGIMTQFNQRVLHVGVVFAADGESEIVNQENEQAHSGEAVFTTNHEATGDAPPPVLDRLPGAPETDSDDTDTKPVVSIFVPEGVSVVGAIESAVAAQEITNAEADAALRENSAAAATGDDTGSTGKKQGKKAK